jgi:hypothetical protein
MTTRKQFEKVIIKKSDRRNTNGYVLNNEDNLIDGVSLDMFLNDLMQGSGNELISKFNALYSSSALAVNNFAIVKKHLKDFSFLGYSGFKNSTFERQFKTGLTGTPPNLDFVLENDEVVIAFESKYLELLDTKVVKFKESYSKNNLKYLDNFWFELIDRYIGEKLYLDVAQLIKHAIGLTNYRLNLSLTKTQKVILVYIFWTPNNSNKFDEYEQHSKELSEFTDVLKNRSDIEFKSMTYNQFWNFYNESPIFKEHFDRLKSRYSIDI